MSLNKRIILCVVIILALVGSCYGIEYAFKTNGLQSASILKVNDNNTQAALFDPSVLSKLPGCPGQNQAKHEGPTLSAVLNAAGVSNYAKVLVNGQKIAAALEINSSEIDNNLIFYFTDHKSVNLGKRGDYPHFLVEDVTEINAVK